MGRDDFPPQLMPLELAREAPAQRPGKIALEGGGNGRFLRDVGGEQMVVDLHFRVGEQHSALGRGESEPRGLALGDLLVRGQELDRAMEAPGALQGADEARLLLDQLRRYLRRHRQALRLERIVAQHQRGDLVGHLGKLPVSLLEREFALAHRRVEQDLDVDLVVRAVHAGRIVDGVGIDAPARERELDAPELGKSEVAAFGDHLAAQLAAVYAQGVVGAVAHLRVAFAARLDVGAYAAVVEQVDRRLENRAYQLARRQRPRLDAEDALRFTGKRDRLGAARPDAAAPGNELRLVIRPT